MTYDLLTYELTTFVPVARLTPLTFDAVSMPLFCPNAATPMGRITGVHYVAVTTVDGRLYAETVSLCRLLGVRADGQWVSMIADHAPDVLTYLVRDENGRLTSRKWLLAVDRVACWLKGLDLCRYNFYVADLIKRNVDTIEAMLRGAFTC